MNAKFHSSMMNIKYAMSQKGVISISIRWDGVGWISNGL